MPFRISGATISGQVLGAMATAIGGYLLTQVTGGWLIHQLGGITAADVDAKIERRAGGVLTSVDIESIIDKHPGPQGVPGRPGVGLVAGAVVAFVGSDVDETHCPDGWAPYIPVRGRVLVGAGTTDGTWSRDGGDTRNRIALTNYEAQRPGGEESHILTIAEMPRHRHLTAILLGDPNFPDFPISSENHKGIAGVGGATTTAAYSAEAGGGKEFKTMPPYLPLYFCKKS